MLFDLYRYRTDTVGISLWEDERLKKWAHTNLMPDDVFAVVAEGMSTTHSHVVKVYRFSDDAVGWVAKEWIVQRAYKLENKEENNP